MAIGWSPWLGGAAAEKFALCVQLRVYLKTYDYVVVHEYLIKIAISGGINWQQELSRPNSKEMSNAKFENVK